MNAVPRKFIYEETSFGGNQYLIELQPDGSLGLMSAYGALPIGLKYLDYSLPSKSTWEVFRREIGDFDYNDLNDELICDGICIELWVTYRHKIKFSAISGGSCKLDELKKILNPLSVCDTFPQGIFFEEFEC